MLHYTYRTVPQEVGTGFLRLITRNLGAPHNGRCWVLVKARPSICHIEDLDIYYYGRLYYLPTTEDEVRYLAVL